MAESVPPTERTLTEISQRKQHKTEIISIKCHPDTLAIWENFSSKYRDYEIALLKLLEMCAPGGKVRYV